jgi:hypothetical protein
MDATFLFFEAFGLWLIIVYQLHLTFAFMVPFALPIDEFGQGE